jgi:dTDP-4-dehydrorhamnose reductase
MMQIRKILITGASGQLGSYLLDQLRGSSDHIIAWSSGNRQERSGTRLQPVDLANADQVARCFEEAKPNLVLHVAALASIVACSQAPERAEKINHLGTALLAELAARSKSRLLYVSTDLVFDGEKGNYREEDEAHPLSTYGRTKLAGEKAALAIASSLVVRVSLLLGPSLHTERPNFFDQQSQTLLSGQSIGCFVDEWRTPLTHRWAARMLLKLLGEWDGTGLLHLGGPERLSRSEMGQRLAQRLGVAAQKIEPIARAAGLAAEPRPRDVSLNSELWRRMVSTEPWPTWETAL